MLAIKIMITDVQVVVILKLLGFQETAISLNENLKNFNNLLF
ncbi:MAG: hypothetical protein G01um10143_655 [Parcubacteria group bacterium Gr01-1014_3]|nr:MAG: hypothetical protein G01um10143_655 [Parcubacteria group bacterium Gr01-1014_3]